MWESETRYMKDQFMKFNAYFKVLTPIYCPDTLHDMGSIQYWKLPNVLARHMTIDNDNCLSKE